MTKIKICGLMRQEDITAVNCLLPDYIGYIFASGRRRVTPEQALQFSRNLRPEICPVGVFVNEKADRICRIVEQGSIRAVQLHGQETPEQVGKLKKRLEGIGALIPGMRDRAKVPIIRAVRMDQDHRLDEWEQSEADYLILDAGEGGTGTVFDHCLLEKIERHTKPWFLAGGMNPDNAAEAVRRFHPFGIDVSSGVETDGRKDKDKIERMIRSIRNE